MEDLMLEMQNKVKLLDAAISQFGKRGREKAEADCNYRIALSQALLLERENGIPATILLDVCRGKKEIASLRLKRDIAESMYDSCKEAINAYKAEMKVLEDQIQREWSQS